MRVCAAARNWKRLQGHGDVGFMKAPMAVSVEGPLIFLFQPSSRYISVTKIPTRRNSTRVVFTEKRVIPHHLVTIHGDSKEPYQKSCTLQPHPPKNAENRPQPPPPSFSFPFHNLTLPSCHPPFIHTLTPHTTPHPDPKKPTLDRHELACHNRQYPLTVLPKKRQKKHTVVPNLQIQIPTPKPPTPKATATATVTVAPDIVFNPSSTYCQSAPINQAFPPSKNTSLPSSGVRARRISVPATPIALVKVGWYYHQTERNRPVRPPHQKNLGAKWGNGSLSGSVRTQLRALLPLYHWFPFLVQVGFFVGERRGGGRKEGKEGRKEGRKERREEGKEGRKRQEHVSLCILLNLWTYLDIIETLGKNGISTPEKEASNSSLASRTLSLLCSKTRV